MRVALCVMLCVFGVSVIACGTGKRDGGGGDGGRDASLPAATVPATGRVNEFDLYMFYFEQQPFRTHTHEGKKVLVKFNAGGESADAPDGSPVVVGGFDGGFKRPRLVAKLKIAAGHKKEKRTDTIYVEGVLVGPKAFAEVPWAKDWMPLTPQNDRTADYFVLIDEALLVAPPSD